MTVSGRHAWRVPDIPRRILCESSDCSLDSGRCRRRRACRPWRFRSGRHRGTGGGRFGGSRRRSSLRSRSRRRGSPWRRYDYAPNAHVHGGCEEMFKRCRAISTGSGSGSGGGGGGAGRSFPLAAKARLPRPPTAPHLLSTRLECSHTPACLILEYSHPQTLP